MITNLKNLMTALEAQNEKFESGNHKAGSDMRKTLLEVRKEVKTTRDNITAKQKENKAARDAARATKAIKA